jgi:hypothetical protein
MIRVQPKIFLTAVLLSLFACILLGRLVGNSGYLKDVRRLNHFLNPMFHFYPTATSLKAKALTGLRPGQTLVLIGGNSNFNGVSQTDSELWTLRLQEMLGDEFKVENFATMGSESLDLAGVVFRMVESEWPNTILVVNTYTGTAGTIDGIEHLYEKPAPFAYFFWDAYYKGHLSVDSHLRDKARRLQRAEYESSDSLREMHLGAAIDGLVYARDLWSYLDYDWFFSIWLANRNYAPFVARTGLVDLTESPPPLAQRIARSGMNESEIMHIVRAHFEGIVFRNSEGKIVPVEEKSNHFIETHADLLSAKQKRKTLFCVLWPNPFYTRKLNVDDRELINFAIPNGVNTLEKLGYRAISIGADFDDEDFETSFHYVASGGKKVAGVVAERVREMAKTLP